MFDRSCDQPVVLHTCVSCWDSIPESSVVVCGGEPYCSKCADIRRQIDEFNSLTADNANLKQRIAELINSTSTTAALAKQVDDMDADNARLRKLLRVCRNRLHMFPQLCTEIDAELAKGE